MPALINGIIQLINFICEQIIVLVFPRNTLWVENIDKRFPRCVGSLCAHLSGWGLVIFVSEIRFNCFVTHPDERKNGSSQLMAALPGQSFKIKTKMLLNNFRLHFALQLINRLNYQLPCSCIPLFQRAGHTGRKSYK